MIDYAVKKNFPQPTKETERYWQGCRNHELLIQYCPKCDAYQFYPRLICTGCSSRNLKWVPSSGRGKVVSYSIIHRAPSLAYKDETPYVVALIQLEEGPTMMSNVIQCKPADVAVDMIVSAVFEEWSDNITIPKFRPINREFHHLHNYLKL
jgi:uncharacterized protein